MNGMVPSLESSDSPACFTERPEGESKRADEALRDSEERFRMIADSCPSMMWATSAEGAFNFTNKACCDFFGKTHDELESTKQGMLTHPDDAPGVLAATKRAVGDRAALRIEARFRRADGEWRLLGLFAEPMISSSGEYLGHIGLCADITERKRTEDALQESEQRHRQIVNSSSEGIWQIDKDYRTIDVNARMASMLGYERSEMLGRPLEYFLFEDELKEQAKRFEARRKGVAEQYECRWRHKDGRSVWTMVSATPVMDVNNLFCGVLGMITDISKRKRAEEALIISERRHRALFESAGDAIFLIRDGTFIDCNEMTLQMYGCTREQIIGHSPLDFSPSLQPDGKRSPEAAMDNINLALSVKTPVRFEWQHCRADKTPFDAEVSLNQLDMGGEVYLSAIVKDISARKRTERELEQHRAHLEEMVGARTEELTIASRMLRALIDNIPDFMYVKDLKSRFMLANLHLVRAFGAKKPEDLLGKTDFDYYPQEMASAFREDEQNVIRSGQPIYNREEKGLDDAGNEVHILTTKVPLRDSQGQVIGIAGIGHDITVRKKMESALREAEQKYRGIFDKAVVGIFQSTPEGRFLSVNPSLARTFGYDSPQDMITSITDLGRQFYADPERRKEFIRLLSTTGSVQNFECEAFRKDGSKAWLSTTARSVVQDGVVVRYEGMGEDISARKKMEDALREAEKKYRSIFDKAVIGIFQSTPEGRFLSVNPSMAFTFGYDSPEEMVASITDMSQHFFANPKRGFEFMLVMDRIGGVKNFECEASRKDGSKIWIAMSIGAIREKGMVVRYEGMSEDITERKKMEGALREAELKYRGIFDTAVFGIFQSTPEGRFLSVNHSMAFTFGYDSPEEMIASITDIAHQFYADPKRREEFKLSMEKLGAVQNFECEGLRKDGSKIWLAMSVRAIRENGVIIRYEGMCQDITERNHLQHKLLQAYKLESVGQLAAGIAHEINTPTQYIGDNVRFLKDAFQDLKRLLGNYERLLSAANDNTLSRETIQDVAAAVKRADTGYLLDEIPKAIDQTLEGVTRVAAIVGAMKEFSHPDTKEKIPLDLNHAINSTITVARNEWKYVADLETEFDPSLPLVSCLPGEFNQVILNLIVNAAHAIADVVKKGGPEKGKISVQTRNCTEWIEIRIQDTGTGIPKKAQSRIFDPFFTTKEIGKGTGQGLSIARSVIVDKHGGSIHFETEEGKGTTFIIRLPLNGKGLPTKAVAA
jgi:PAS domain S-box-containing protein